MEPSMISLPRNSLSRRGLVGGAAFPGPEPGPGQRLNAAPSAALFRRAQMLGISGARGWGKETRPAARQGNRSGRATVPDLLKWMFISGSSRVRGRRRSAAELAEALMDDAALL